MAKNLSRAASRRLQELLKSIKQLPSNELDRLADLIAKDEYLFDAILDRSESFQQLAEAIRISGRKSEELTKNIESQRPIVQAMIVKIALLAAAAAERKEITDTLIAAVRELTGLTDQAGKLIWKLGLENKQLEADYQKMIPKPRFEDRDDEIVRLRDEIIPDGKQRTFGQILLLICDRWPTTQAGDPLTRDAVCSAYKRRKKLPSNAPDAR